jgi:hypothetical protein
VRHCTVASMLLSTTARRRIAVGGSGAPCRGCGLCMSRAGSRSSGRSAAGSPVDCWSGPHRCGPSPMPGAGPTRRWLRHRSRSSATAHRRDTPGCSDCGGRQSTRRRFRARVSCWHRGGPRPDRRYRNKPSDCASRVLNRNRDIASRSETTTHYRQAGAVGYWSLLSGLNRWPTYYKYVALPLS